MQMRSDEAINPLKLDEHCTLFSKRAAPMYYTHTYDPTAIIAKVIRDLQISEEVLGRFDSDRREGCCNVISITIYITCRRCTEPTLEKYLYSVHRSVKNVLKNLPGWIVRVYFDTSVEACVIKDEFCKFNAIFNAIKDSPNVEVYTYDCPSFKKAEPPATRIPMDRTRTLRFLPLSDPEVNFCIVRDADGIVSNLDCHNIKMFATNPDILFYLPVFEGFRSSQKFDSYAPWLHLYKGLFEYDYFNVHQNITDFLAGAFCCRLKLKRAYYLEITKSLQERIDSVFTTELMPKQLALTVQTASGRMIPISRILTDAHNQISISLNNGFDEIVLLAIYKEFVSLKVVCVDDGTPEPCKINWAATTEVEDKIKTMLIADNILTIGTNAISGQWRDFITIYDELVEKNIIHPLTTLNNLLQTINVTPQHHLYSGGYYIDSILLGNIIAMIPFNVVVPTGAVAKSYVSALWNMPYTLDFDRFYDRVVASGPGGGKRKRRFKLGRISRISRNTKFKKPTRYRKKKRLTRRK